MPIGGRRPKPAGQAVTRHPRVYDWTHVENTPNRGGPRLPVRRRNGKPWPTHVRARWRAWREMPHARLWQPSDWEFALDTAELLAHAAEADGGGSVAMWSEIRLRERTLGATWDARLAQRLRYVAPKTDEDTPASVARLDEYRDL